MKMQLSFLFAFGVAVGAVASEPSKDEIIDRAQRGEPAAYMAMANCYRRGADGFEKSMFNAKCCYDLAAADPEVESPADEFALFFQLIGSIRADGLEASVERFGQAPLPSTPWVSLFENLAVNRNRSDLCDYTLSLIGDDSTADECFTAFAVLHALAADSRSITPDPKVKLIAAKVPYLYNWSAEKALELYKASSEANTRLLDEAIKDFRHAFDSAMLLPENAEQIVELSKTHPRVVAKHFRADELAKLVRVGGKE